MNRTHFAPMTGAAIFLLLTATLAACGGGGNGGGGGTPPTTSPTTGPTASPTAPPTATPVPTPTPAVAGVLQLNGAALANGRLAYTCGCSAQAGVSTTNGMGNFSITAVATANPLTPSPTYTAVPGRNYVVIGYAPTSFAQVWTMVFLGKTPATNLNLSGNSNGVSTDTASEAAALYIYYEAGLLHSSGDQSFDNFNFNSILAWTQSMRTSGGNNPAEVQLFTDIVNQSSGGFSLYPSVPAWNPVSGASANATIVTDLHNVAGSTDRLLPTPCPGGVGSCTGTPTP